MCNCGGGSRRAPTQRSSRSPKSFQLPKSVEEAPVKKVEVVASPPSKKEVRKVEVKKVAPPPPKKKEVRKVEVAKKIVAKKEVKKDEVKKVEVKKVAPPKKAKSIDDIRRKNE